MEKRGGENKNKKLEISLIIISLTLFLFFVLPFFHNWANNLRINLHFCNHVACMIYSLIWLAFAIIGIYFLIKKKEMKRLWIIIYLVVLIIGIVLMNLIVCDSSGKINFNFNPTLSQKDIDNNKNGFLDDDFNYSNSTWISDISNCTDSDGGLIPEVRGRISGLADGELTETGSQDTCHFGMLYELYCEEDNYFSIEVDCKEYFESDFAYCEEGICKLSEEVDCRETCEFYGFSNSRGPFMNCSTCNSNESCNFFVAPDVVIYGDTPALCCCNNNVNTLCGDYAVENDYEYWTLTEDDCENTATVNCGVYGLILEEFFVKFFAEEGDCCVWTCKTSDDCIDKDGDGYGSPASSFCSYSELDCDDSDTSINPGATEICDDGIDNNCNELIDCDDSYCEEQEICKIPCTDSAKPICGGYCPVDYTCKYNELNEYCYCGTFYCKDSDDGFNLTVQGTCDDGVFNNIDTCTEDNEKVIEWMCGETGCVDFVYDCEYGCEEGACKFS